MSDLSAVNPDLKPRDPSTPIDFDPITILGWISGDVRHDKLGDIKFTITVPHQYRELAYGIWEARGAPLVIRFEKWRGPDAESS